MTVDVANYFAQLGDKKGKLERWETDIFQLHHAGVSYQKIAEFLKLNGAESNKMEVYRFIHRKKRRHLLVTKPGIPPVAEKKQKGGAEHTAPKSEPAAKPAEIPEQQDTQSRPKFKFRESLGKDKTKW